MTYDKDRSNSLEPNELANFFNDVFEKMNNPDRFTINQAMSAMRMVDANFDGRASKQELFNALKYMMANPAGNAYVSGSSSSNMNNTGYSNQQSYSSSSYNQNTYGNNGMNTNQQTQLNNTATSFLDPQPSSFNSYDQGQLNNAATSIVGPYSGQPSLINNLSPTSPSTISHVSYSGSSYAPGSVSYVQNVPASGSQVIYTTSTVPAPVIRTTPLIASTVN